MKIERMKDIYRLVSVGIGLAQAFLCLACLPVTTMPGMLTVLACTATAFAIISCYLD